MKMCNWVLFRFHKWSKWVHGGFYIDRETRQQTGSYQYRSCEVCNKKESRDV